MKSGLKAPKSAEKVLSREQLLERGSIVFSKSSKKKKSGFESEDKNKANFETTRLTLEGDQIKVSEFAHLKQFEIDELDKIGKLGNDLTEKMSSGWGVEIHEIDDTGN